MSAVNDQSARGRILMRLEETGELQRIKQTLQMQLTECGWRDEMRDAVRESIRAKGGVVRATLDELVFDLIPRGRSAVPENVKGSLVRAVRDFVRKENGEPLLTGEGNDFGPGMSEV